MPRGHAFAGEPDPSWGRQLVGSDAAHLAHFDRERDRILRTHNRVGLAAVVALGAGFMLLIFPVARPVSTLGVVLFSLGLLGGAGARWIPYRLSFAAHRMWGVYEHGLVAPLYIKGGVVALVPWHAVENLRLRRIRVAGGTPGEEVFLFRAQERKHKYRIHRIWESDLKVWFGYEPAELAKMREEILTAVRQCLPAESVIVEQEPADS